VCAHVRLGLHLSYTGSSKNRGGGKLGVAAARGQSIGGRSIGGRRLGRRRWEGVRGVGDGREVGARHESIATLRARGQCGKNRKKKKKCDQRGWQVGQGGRSVCVQADPNRDQIWWTNGSVRPKTRTKIKIGHPAGLAFLSGGHKRTAFVRLGWAAGDVLSS
jgi:hypothetical protein